LKIADQFLNGGFQSLNWQPVKGQYETSTNLFFNHSWW